MRKFVLLLLLALVAVVSPSHAQGPKFRPEGHQLAPHMYSRWHKINGRWYHFHYLRRKSLLNHRTDQLLHIDYDSIRVGLAYQKRKGPATAAGPFA